ncbi:uncharacterized protein LOC130452936 [Diorhabda sublineata]|uniref:uncharacterized protein LOC130452936 n=1 Tax=Diorhabda sublineata TaxID=1163346 RepID=UPI0024E0D1B5|nr:uncharacterized protein LOC130452936 [Diorhabda sublineata]
MKDKNIPKYVPSFYIGEIKLDVELPYYLLTRKLKCVAPYIINKLQVNNITSAIFIQDDGTLQVKNRDNNSLYRREEYCTDTFSDGFIENTYVGGLSCPSIEIMHDIVEEHEHHQKKKKNSIKMQSKSEESDSSASKIFFFEIAGIGFAIILFLY